MVAGLLVLAGGVVAFGEVVMRACQLVGVAGFGCQPECCRQLGAGGGRLTDPVQSLGQSPEREDLAVLVVADVVQRECLLAHSKRTSPDHRASPDRLIHG